MIPVATLLSASLMVSSGFVMSDQVSLCIPCTPCTWKPILRLLKLVTIYISFVLSGDGGIIRLFARSTIVTIVSLGINMPSIVSCAFGIGVGSA